CEDRGGGGWGGWDVEGGAGGEYSLEEERCVVDGPRVVEPRAGAEAFAPCATAGSGGVPWWPTTVRPPSTTSACPLTYEDSSPASQRIAAAISSGVPVRRSAGQRVNSRSRAAGSGTVASQARTPSVRTVPGQTALTRTPEGPQSTAICRASPITPAFAAAYAACSGNPRIPCTEETATIEPRPRGTIRSAALDIARYAAVRLRSTTRRHSSGEVSCAAAVPAAPPTFA